jgi:hypothetical protein
MMRLARSLVAAWRRPGPGNPRFCQERVQSAVVVVSTASVWKRLLPRVRDEALVLLLRLFSLALEGPAVDQEPPPATPQDGLDPVDLACRALGDAM